MRQGATSAKLSPDLSTSFEKLNRLFKSARSTRTARRASARAARRPAPAGADERNRQESYLYWLGWTAHNTTSLFNSANAHWGLRGGSTSAACPARRWSAGQLFALIAALLGTRVACAP